MKILVIGDFHGRFPVKLKKEAKKADLVISLADYCPFFYREVWFKHCYHSNTELWEVIGKKRYAQWIKKDLKHGEKVIKELNKLSVPVHTVIGNLDYTGVADVYDPKKSKWKWPEQDFFTNILKKYKNIRRFDYSFFKFNDLVFIGSFGHTFPGKVKSKNYRKYKKKVDKLFNKYKKEKVIFVSHIVPYNTKLDKITAKYADKDVKGKHYGSKLIRRIILKYKPLLALGGHIHENQGKQKLGRTLIVNPGAVVDGKAAIIELDDKTKNVKKIKFLR